MLGKSWQWTFPRVIATLVLLSIAITAISGAQDHDVPVSVDGIRCDSCGSECSVMCGSRSFRACCYNYIKKRSVPWSGDNMDDDNHQEKGSPIAGSESKPGPSSPLKKHPSGKHLLKGYLPEITLDVDSIEEGEYIYPVAFRSLVANMVRNLNALENRKLGRNLMF